MKVRIKFAKHGPVKFVGHLDTMRYFQKAIRRAELPIAFSGGYSPHMIMSFAAPLGVGTESDGEYFDMELTQTVPTEVIEQRLNAQMVEGFQILSARQVEDGKASTAMSLVAAADYLVTFRDGCDPADTQPDIDWKSRIEEFLSKPEILVMKKTKRGEKEIDLKPNIYQMKLHKNGIFYQLASASSNYTKPELVTETFFHWLGSELKPFAMQICRLETYAMDQNETPISLENLGEKVE